MGRFVIVHGPFVVVIARASPPAWPSRSWMSQKTHTRVAIEHVGKDT